MTVATLIDHKVREGLAPTLLEIVDESSQHNVPPGSESHFKVTVVAAGFEGQRPLARHRAVMALLADELAGPVHALALHTFTPKEWAARGVAPQSPACAGGDGTFPKP